MFWPGEFHGLYSSWPRKELDTTERLSLFTTEKNINMQHLENTENWNGVKSTDLIVTRTRYDFGLERPGRFQTPSGGGSHSCEEQDVERVWRRDFPPRARVEGREGNKNVWLGQGFFVMYC